MLTIIVMVMTTINTVITDITVTIMVWVAGEAMIIVMVMVGISFIAVLRCHMGISKLQIPPMNLIQTHLMERYASLSLHLQHPIPLIYSSLSDHRLTLLKTS